MKPAAWLQVALLVGAVAALAVVCSTALGSGGTEEVYISASVTPASSVRCNRIRLPAQFYNDTTSPYNPAAMRHPSTGLWYLLHTFDEVRRPSRAAPALPVPLRALNPLLCVAAAASCTPLCGKAASLQQTSRAARAGILHAVGHGAERHEPRAAAQHPRAAAQAAAPGEAGAAERQPQGACHVRVRRKLPRSSPGGRVNILQVRRLAVRAPRKDTPTAYAAVLHFRQDVRIVEQNKRRLSQHPRTGPLHGAAASTSRTGFTMRAARSAWQYPL